jgi:DNA polymerase III subunit epsilon
MYVVIDFETTGLNYTREQVTEIAGIKLNEKFEEVAIFHTFVKLKEGNQLSKFTDITQVMVDTGLDEKDAFEILDRFLSDSVVVAQYAPFDFAFLSKYGIHPQKFICTKSLTSQAEPDESSSLGSTCKRLGIELINAHRAVDDARATGKVLEYRIKQGGLKIFNTLVVTEGRPFNFIPRSTDVILTKSGLLVADFTQTKGGDALSR